MFPFLFRLFFLAALLIPASAQADHGVFRPESFTLNNGMQVVVITNARVPVVTHMVWYKVGSADEPPGKSGMAHFFEHLMFKGTKDHPNGEFSATVARNGGQENAFTARDYTGYYQTVAKDRLGLMMELEADRMRNLVLIPELVEPERLVILEERAQRTDNNPSALLREHINAALFMNHSYRRPVVGWRHEVKAVSVEDLRAFYRQWYAPDNAILVVAGDITAAELKPLAEKTYGRIAPQGVAPRVREAEPPHHAARRIALKDRRVRQTVLSRIYLAPSHATGAAPQTVYALEVMADILGGGASSVLYRDLIVDRQLAVSVSVSYDGDGLGPGTLSLSATPRRGVTVEALETALDQAIEDVLKTPFPTDRVDRAIRRMKAEAVFARDGLTTGARVLGAALASGRTIKDVEEWPHHIGQVTPDAIAQAAREAFVAVRSVTAVLLPQDGEAKP